MSDPSRSAPSAPSGRRGAFGPFLRRLAIALPLALVASRLPASATVVVRSVPADGAFARAGLQPGDRIEGWTTLAPATDRELAAGTIATPVDLLAVEQRWAPAGRVVLRGGRAGTPASWAIPRGSWRHESELDLSPGQRGWLERAPVAPADRLAAPPPGNSDRAAFLVQLAADREAEPGGKALLEEAAVARIADPVDRASFLAWRAGRRPAVGAERLRALDELREAFELRRSAGQPEDPVDGALLLERGRLFHGVSDVVHARALFTQGVELVGRLGLEWPELPLRLRGLQLQMQGRWLDAAEVHACELELFSAIAPWSAEHRSALSSLGYVLWVAGDLAGAKARLDEFAAMAASGWRNELAESDALRQRGGLRMEWGDLAGAEEDLRLALALAEALPGDSVQRRARLYRSLGDLAWSRNELETAVFEFERAGSGFREMASRSGELATTLEWLAGVRLDQGNIEASHALLAEGLAMHSILSPTGRGVAICHELLGRLELQAGRPERALPNYLAALAIREKASSGSLWTTWSLAGLARASDALGDASCAEERYRLVVERTARFAPGSRLEASARFDLARFLRANGRPAEALGEFRRMLEALESQESRLGGGEDAKTAFRAGAMEMFRGAIDLLLELGELEEAFGHLERSRAQQLLDLMSRRELDFGDDLPAGLASEWSESRLALRQASANLRREGGPMGELLAELARRRRRAAELDALVAAAVPRLAPLVFPHPLSPDEVRRRLPPDAAAILWSVGAERGHALVLRGADLPGPPLSTHPVAASRDELAERVDRHRSALLAAPGSAAWAEKAEREGRRLADLLLAAPLDGLESARTLLLVPDGPIHLVPFAALPDPAGRRLLERRTISVVPSLSVWATLRDRPRGSDDRIAAFADPAYTEATTRALRGRAEPGALPGARREVARISDLFPGRTESWLGPTATEERTRSLGSARIFHFATHAFADTEAPLESALLLSPGGPHGDDGLLRAWEVVERGGFDGDLVVLSACESALGRAVDGEGMIGLTRSFLLAGARSVVASLWPVDDDSTAELFSTFYRGIREGLAPGEALRRAQLSLAAVPAPGRQDHTAPFHWAGFQLIGAEGP